MLDRDFQDHADVRTQESWDPPVDGRRDWFGDVMGREPFEGSRLRSEQPVQQSIPAGEAADLNDLDRRSKDELYEVAKRLKIEGRCRMSREQLLEAIRALT